MRLRHYISLLFLVIYTSLQAQNYPVQVMPQVVPPYSLALSEYQESYKERLYVNLLLKDINVSSRNVRVRMQIKGNGINVQTAEYAVGARPIFLIGGIPTRLSNIDLGYLFDLQNLQGLTAAQYNQPLADGVYQFCFEAFDNVTNQRLSSESCTTVYLQLNDPPYLALPSRGEVIQSKTPENIVFQWTPRQVNATNVQYEFELREIWDNQVDPQAVFLASPNLYTKRVYGTSLLYGISEPMLIPGKRYAWRVKALSTDGINENAVFKNDGYSEIYYFDYTETCEVPTFALSEIKSEKSVTISWQSPMGTIEQQQYQVQYRKASGEGKWFTTNSMRTQATIYNLEPNTRYEFRVGMKCGSNGDGYVYGNRAEFEMPSKEEAANYDCSIIPEIELTNQTLLDKDLGKNQVFTAGDFPVTVIAASGIGRYTGNGYIQVPYLGDTKIAVEFSGISINTDYQLIEGTIETAYDPDWKNVDFISEETGELFGDPGIQTQEVPFEITTIEQIELQDDGTVIIRNPNGGVDITLPPSKDYNIVDSKGNVYSVDEEGNIAYEGKQGEGGTPTAENTNGLNSKGEANQITAEGVVVRFTKAQRNPYAYDTVTNETTAEEQENYTELRQGIYKAYQFVEKGEEAVMIVEVDITDDSIKKEDIIFKRVDSGLGIELSSSWTGNKAELTLTTNASFGAFDVIATVKNKNKQDIAGAIRVVSGTRKDIRLTPVAVNGVNIPNGLSNTLNEIYNPVGVYIQLNADKDISIADDGELEVSSNFLANYSPEQREWIASLKAEKDDYYMFFTDIKPSKPIAGVMPLGRQYGFIFTNDNAGEEQKGNVRQVVAHELGHGALQLKHPWEAYGTRKENTNRLMDYGGGQFLNHQDWEQIQDPGLQLHIFNNDESGQYNIQYLDYVCVPENLYANKAYFQDLDGRTMYLPTGDRIRPLAFVGRNDKIDSLYGRVSILVNTETNERYYPIANQESYSYYHTIVENDSLKLKEKEPVRGVEIVTDKTGERISVDSNFEIWINGANTNQIYRKARCCAFKRDGCNYDDDGGNNGNPKTMGDVFANSGKYEPTYTDPTGNVLDYSRGLSSEYLNEIFQAINETESTTGINGQVIITDEKYSTPEELKLAEETFNNGRELVTWVQLDSNNKTFDIKINSGTLANDNDGFHIYVDNVVSVTTAMGNQDLIEDIGNPFTEVLDALAGLIQKGKIPEKYWNPEHTDYNPIPFRVYSATTVFTMPAATASSFTSYMGVGSSEINALKQHEFAFVCGLWNGAINLIAGIPQGASTIIKLITNEDETRDKLLEALSNTSWSSIKQLMGEQFNQFINGLNSYQKTEKIGRITLDVITIVASFAKLGYITKAVNVLDKLDAFSLVGNFAGKLTGTLLRPVMSGVGDVVKGSSKLLKVALVETAQLSKRVKLEVPMNLYCGVPLPKVSISPKIANEAGELTDEAIDAVEAKVKNTNVEELPIDDNGTMIIEADVDGEKFTAVLNESKEKLDDLAKEAVNSVSSIIEKLRKELPSWKNEDWNALEKALNENPNILSGVNTKEYAESWKFLKESIETDGSSNSLYKKADAIEALTNARKYTTKLGVTDVQLSRIRVSNNAEFSYAELMDKLTNIGKKATDNKTTLNNFYEKVLKKLDPEFYKGKDKKYITRTTRGAEGVVKALDDHFDELLKGKNVKFEHKVSDARNVGTKSAEDLTVEIEAFGRVKKEYSIEVKNCLGSDCVDLKTIKNQFIERDLYNATDISQIKWKIYGQDFTKAQFVEYLTTHVSAIDAIINNGNRNLANWFNVPTNSPLSNIRLTEQQIQTFANRYYDEIFL